jgi:hypothetical protein
MPCLVFNVAMFIAATALLALIVSVLCSAVGEGRSSIIARHPYGNHHSDATAARDEHAMLAS